MAHALSLPQKQLFVSSKISSKSSFIQSPVDLHQFSVKDVDSNDIIKIYSLKETENQQMKKSD